MPDRDIDLVIHDEKDMKIFLMFLIVRLDTYDGKPGSIEKLRQKRHID
jgi:hypothetical protein